ncbi:MAG: NAD(P)-dependent alcohol dehydrogenase [Alphaproteobacteria bacterium]|nr:NAD(P)-dependent alcohol dehydrogenase [Alphaproteobacteria bacterium]
MRSYLVPATARGLDDLRLIERPSVKPGPGQVRLRPRAATLNGRDQYIVHGTYLLFRLQRDTVPLSDGAGEIIDVGPDVTRFKPGDRVMTTFFQRTPAAMPEEIEQQLGGPLDGVLAEEVVLDQDGVVPIPGDLSFAEAAALPCAALTAWSALMETGRPLRPGDTVLVLGTGGVSVFGLQFARAAGARVIVTSSSDAKLARAKDLGAFAGLNYRTTPDWHQEVLRLTQGRGADCILEVGGYGTLSRSIQCLAPNGRICLIGVLAGPGETNNLHLLRPKRGSIHGIAVGPRDMLLRMNRAVTAQGLRPVIDRVFPFDRAKEAYRAQAAGDFFGKIAIEIP